MLLGVASPTGGLRWGLDDLERFRRDDFGADLPPDANALVGLRDPAQNVIGDSLVYFSVHNIRVIHDTRACVSLYGAKFTYHFDAFFYSISDHSLIRFRKCENVLRNV